MQNLHTLTLQHNTTQHHTTVSQSYSSYGASTSGGGGGGDLLDLMDDDVSPVMSPPISKPSQSGGRSFTFSLFCFNYLFQNRRMLSSFILFYLPTCNTISALMILSVLGSYLSPDVHYLFNSNFNNFSYPNFFSVILTRTPLSGPFRS